MTVPDLLRQLAQPAQDAYQNTVTVTVPTRLLTALADQLDALSHVVICDHDAETGRRADALYTACAEVERAAKEHTSQ